MSQVRVKGLSELNRFLQQLPAKLEQNVMRGALRRGARVIMLEAKRLAPVGPTSMENMRLYGGYSGALRDSIRITSTRLHEGRVIATVAAGGETKRGADVYYAHFVEFGTAAHTIKAPKGGALEFAGGWYTSVQHPGTPAKPFMRPALDGAAQSAVVATAEYMKRRLAAKHGLDTADVEIETE
jgi:HK97 gp10 family phage protein